MLTVYASLVSPPSPSLTGNAVYITLLCVSVKITVCRLYTPAMSTPTSPSLTGYSVYITLLWVSVKITVCLLYMPAVSAHQV